MSASNYAVHPQLPFDFAEQITTANTATNGTGTITELCQAPAEGSRIKQLGAGVYATLAADTVVRFFVQVGGAGPWFYRGDLDLLLPSHTLAVTTANAGIGEAIDEATADNILELGPNTKLGATLGATASIVVWGFGWNYTAAAV